MKNKKILVSLPLKVIAEVDKQVSHKQYYSRSEYIRELIREGLENERKKEDALANLQKFARKNLRQYGIKV